MRGLANPKTASLLLDGWLVHYNFFRPHESLNGKTPAEKAGIQFRFTDWLSVVRGDIRAGKTTKDDDAKTVVPYIHYRGKIPSRIIRPKRLRRKPQKHIKAVAPAIGIIRC